MVTFISRTIVCVLALNYIAINMTTANTTAKIAAVLAGFGLVASSFAVFAPAARAQSAADLQAQINALLAQIAALQGNTGTTASVSFSRDLTLGATGSDVTALQNWLISKGYAISAGATGYFGVQTQAAVAKYQAANGIAPAAGYFGPTTRAHVNAASAGTGTGTGTGTGSTTGALKGGAGDLTITNRTANIEKNLTEGATENVVSFEAEADDNSDLAITSLRVAIDVSGSGSLRANRYIDEVLVLLEDEEVGSADISSFSRSGSVHTATINLKNAVIRSDNKARFYVALVARDSISSDDRNTGTFKVSVDRVRYEDATGAILTDSGFNPAVETTGIKFNAASADNKFSVQNVSGTPASKILKVEETSTSDEYHVLSFRLKTGSKSADVDVSEIVVGIDTVGTTTATAAINDIWLKVGSRTYNDYVLGTAGSESKATFSIDEGDLVVDGDSSEDVEVYVKFNRTNGNYATGEKFTFKVAGADVRAEDVRGNSVGTISGTATGKEQTVAITAATVDSFTWKVSKANNSNAGAITFRFTVDADDDDFSFLRSSLSASTSGTATSSAATWAVVSGDATNNGGTGYTINSGDTATFEVTYSFTGPGTGAATVTSVAGQQVPNDKQYSGLEVF